MGASCGPSPAFDSSESIARLVMPRGDLSYRTPTTLHSECACPATGRHGRVTATGRLCLPGRPWGTVQNSCHGSGAPSAPVVSPARTASEGSAPTPPTVASGTNRRSAVRCRALPDAGDAKPVPRGVGPVGPAACRRGVRRRVPRRLGERTGPSGRRGRPPRTASQRN
jgi:hypothetical protein